jgi:very-short-patch-repair endonuclease
MSLRNKGIEGVRFLRQYSVNKFIIDFYSPALKLGIEIDGESHIGKELYDKNRQKFIESFGIKIIRFTDDEIIGNINKVIDTITNTVKTRI